MIRALIHRTLVDDIRAKESARLVDSCGCKMGAAFVGVGLLAVASQHVAVSGHGFTRNHFVCCGRIRWKDSGYSHFPNALAMSRVELSARYGDIERF